MLAAPLAGSHWPGKADLNSQGVNHGREGDILSHRVKGIKAEAAKKTFSFTDRQKVI